MPIRPFDQKAQFRTDEQAGTYSQAQTKAYRIADPADQPVSQNWKEPYQVPGFTDELAAGEAVAQRSQLRTTEQEGTYTTEEKRAFSNL
jgi:hypothetical protein